MSSPAGVPQAPGTPNPERCPAPKAGHLGTPAPQRAITAGQTDISLSRPLFGTPWDGPSPRCPALPPLRRAGQRGTGVPGKENTPMLCTTRNATRVVLGRHAPDCEAEACTGCLPCPESHCNTCRRTHAEGACPACVAMARYNLTAIEDLTNDLAEEATTGRQATHSGNGVPGGEALVMLAPGTYRPHGYTRPSTEAPNDANPPREVLAYWAARWHADTDTDSDAHTVTELHAHLDAQLHHIAHAAWFPHMARDLAQTVHHLEEVLHDGIRPEVSRVPCWECGTRLVKQYGRQAVEDHWVCPRCKERYDRGRYDRAKHDHLASEGAERYVLLADAVAAVGRSMKTVRTWMDHGKVTAQRDPRTGRVWVWWPDVRTQHLEAATRRRAKRGRRGTDAAREGNR